MPPHAAARQVSQAGSRAPNPVLAGRRRGGMFESWHRGAVAVARPDASLAHAIGDVGRPVFPRSACKLIQALPLVESGAADTLPDEMLALACASHGGEAAHTELAARWLAQIGCREEDLVCGPHMPSHGPTAEAMVKAGESPCRLHNNCSGKHAGFLMMAQHLGADLHYDRLSHPVQRGVRAALSDLSGVGADTMIAGLDGCGAPNYAMPLSALATAYARVAEPSALAPHRARAVARLRKACMAHPFYVAGSGRLCTRLMAQVPGLFVKIGAEGVYVASLPERGLGIAVKADDGLREAAHVLLVAALVGLHAMAPDHPIAQEVLAGALTNTQGLPAAHWHIDADALAAGLGADAAAALRAVVAETSPDTAPTD